MCRRFGLVVMLVLLSLAQAAGQGGDEVDRYGGRRGIRWAATGFFRTTKAERRWWLVDPDGYVFISVGVNGVSLGPRDEPEEGSYRAAALDKHQRQPEWAKATIERLWGWGFNTLGSGADRETWREGMAYTVSLDCARTVPWGEGRTFPDVFDPAYERAVRRHVSRVCRDLGEEHALLGYFTDGELQWQPDEASPLTPESPLPLLAQFLGREDEAPGRRALLGFLEERYLTIGELNEAWRTEYESFEEIGRTPQVGSHIPQEDVDGFLRLAATEYFRIAHDAIREVDDHHLILSCRFSGEAPRPVLEGMGDYVSVVSLNYFGALPPAQHLREIHRVTGWPVLVSGFGFPKGRGVGGEEERGGQYERYVRALLALPVVVGYHWSQYVEPARRLGRERRMSGLVDRSDEPQAAFVEAATRVNRDVYALAARQQIQEKGGER